MRMYHSNNTNNNDSNKQQKDSFLSLVAVFDAAFMCVRQSSLAAAALRLARGSAVPVDLARSQLWIAQRTPTHAHA